MRKCIIHIPNKLRPEMASASQIRPQKMISAFRNIGYDADVVEGVAIERKAQIKVIEKNICSGIKYDFMYSESSTMPTLLTDPKHLPMHPFVDFNFFKFLSKNDIKIGLFYRDMYWKFPVYKKSVKGAKALFAVKMYEYDLRQYNKYLSKLYLPNERCFKHLFEEISLEKMDVLPPGCDVEQNSNRKIAISEGRINLLYVGGLGAQYNIEALLAVLAKRSDYDLTLCCREKEWIEQKGILEKYLTDNIRVVHKSGKELEELYNSAHIGVLFLKPDKYREMAMPYKTFEYMGHGLPVIACEGTAIGDFIDNYGFGWVVPFGEKSLNRLLDRLITKKGEIIKKSINSQKASATNRWEDRAIKVARDLS